MVSVGAIWLPSDFTPQHEELVIRYLADQLHGQAEWWLAMDAFTQLDEAKITIAGNFYTFRNFYQSFVEQRFADPYLHALFALTDIRQRSPALWASYARQIVQAFQNLPSQPNQQTASRLCLSYLLYWWNAFARGYAFEVEIFRDLEQTGVQFQAHNLLVHEQRFSPSDLTVIEQAGDIKTSTYFLYITAPAVHDFYIVRFVNRARIYTVVVMLQPAAWNVINGDTVNGDLSSVLQQLPSPVRIQSIHYEFVIITYDEWKRRILRVQRRS